MNDVLEQNAIIREAQKALRSAQARQHDLQQVIYIASSMSHPTSLALGPGRRAIPHGSNELLALKEEWLKKAEAGGEIAKLFVEERRRRETEQGKPVTAEGLKKSLRETRKNRDGDDGTTK